MKSLFKYHFLTKVNVNNVNKATLVPIYQSSIQESKLRDFTQSYIPFKEYFELVPIFIERSLFNHPKNFVLSMKYSKETNLLVMQCLSHAGIFSKFVVPSSIRPINFGDYSKSYKHNFFEHTTRVDYHMIYWNELQHEIYLFDREGKWQDVEIPELSIEKLFDEKNYLDHYF